MLLVELIYLNPIPSVVKKKSIWKLFLGKPQLDEETFIILELPDHRCIRDSLNALSGNTVRVGKHFCDVYAGKTREKTNPMRIDETACTFLCDLFIRQEYASQIANSSYLLKDQDQLPLISSQYILYVQCCN